MVIPLVNRREAMRKPTHHELVPGLGHVAHAAEPDLPAGYPVGDKNCEPAAGAADKSLHMLQPSHNAPQKMMRWLADHKSWAPADAGQNGNRMAWTANYLMRAGWAYVGPVTEEKAPRRRR